MICLIEVDRIAKINAELKEIVKSLEEAAKSIAESVAEFNPLFFPKVEEWYWDPAVKRGVTLGPRESVEIIDKRGSGWLHTAILWTDNPYATLKVELYTNTILTFDLTIEEVYQLGFYGLGLGQFSVTRYDDTNNVYVMSYVPISYGAPFRNRIRVEVKNPLSASNITVNSAEAILLVFP